ncbi:uncharacterized protein LOC117651813 isoform X2 [Thrips palmi]|uniref:Uncharacterized protein LOC117651813 isoform X2 n=1 Tax=Thrips palmi TaxID=161013 RepID=A0A6P9A2M8_THRPL|nr:uncharacterized protein LOC117651813 isoform X2 [Thrips palmi]
MVTSLFCIVAAAGTSSLTTGSGEPCQRPIGIRCSAAATMDQSLLLALPDDALLAVLAYLPPRQLFSCRLQCRRLRDLCLHPDVWRCVRLDAGDFRFLGRAALRLAPCLRELDLVFGVNVQDAVTELSRTTCVIARLGLVLTGDEDVVRAVAAVQRQSSLGGLSGLRLQFNGLGERNVYPLSVAVRTLNHLYDLTLQNYSGVPLLASLGELEGSPSLKKLSYTSNTKDSLLEATLQTHAATLEHVHLLTDYVPVSLLKALLKLRSLTISRYSTEDLSDLKALPNLTSLHFVGNVSASALKLLRRASRLRSVTVPFCGPHPADPLLALAASPSARVLETLCVRSGSPSDSAQVCGHMAAALPQFPTLRALTMESRPVWSWREVDFEEFFEAVSPTMAPRLTRLAVRAPCGVCPHAWLHDSSVQDLLQRNPGLHLRVLFLCFCQDCSWCLSGCHSDVTARGHCQVTLGAHNRAAGCPPDCYRWKC